MIFLCNTYFTSHIHQCINASSIEILDNCIDESLAEYCKHIEVILHEDGSISIQDDGRGIPVDIHPIAKIPTLRVIYTILQAGGKFFIICGKVSKYS